MKLADALQWISKFKNWFFYSFHEKCVKNPPAMRETWFDPWVGMIPWGRERLKGFPDSSVGKESACNAGDLGSIPGSGRSTGEGIDYTPVFLGFPCGSAGKESTCNAGDLVWSLGWEDPLEKGKATYSSILACRIPWTIVHEVTKSQTQLSDLRFTSWNLEKWYWWTYL